MTNVVAAAAEGPLRRTAAQADALGLHRRTLENAMDATGAARPGARRPRGTTRARGAGYDHGRGTGRGGMGGSGVSNAKERTGAELFRGITMADRVDDPGACFISTMERVAYGELAERAEIHSRDAAQAVIQSGKTAKVTVTLTYKPNGPRGLEVTGEVVSKIPQADLGKSYFFADADGRLSRTPPAEEAGELMKKED